LENFNKSVQRHYRKVWKKMKKTKEVNMSKFLLGHQDLVSLAKGLGIALIGAGLTYLTAYVSKTNFGVYTPLIVTVFALIANIVRKSADGVRQ